MCLNGYTNMAILLLLVSCVLGIRIEDSQISMELGNR
jgi:hypothetical protein